MSTSKSKTKNGQPPEVELDFDLDELREGIGIDALEARIAHLEQTLAEWLIYVNMVDERVQALGGEPTVTVKRKMNIGDDGEFELVRQRPPLPSNLMRDMPRSLPKAGR